MTFSRRISISILAWALVHVIFNAEISSSETSGKPAGRGRHTVKLVCSDQSWYPFVYSDKEIEGIHIDIVRKALEDAGYSVSIQAMPLARCIKMAERDMVDGVISVAYDKNLARFLEYPPGSAEIKESDWRIMQIDDVVVTNIDDNYEFAGDITTLPRPVHVLKAEPVLEELRDMRIETEEADTNWLNYAKFMRHKDGSLVTTSVVALKMDQDESFRGKFVVQAIPLRSRSYYLAFSWGSHLTHEERMRIWSEIVKVRDDYVFMLTTFGKY
jgi:hypothetical protein